MLVYKELEKVHTWQLLFIFHNPQLHMTEQHLHALANLVAEMNSPDYFAQPSSVRPGTRLPVQNADIPFALWFDYQTTPLGIPALKYHLTSTDESRARKDCWTIWIHNVDPEKPQASQDALVAGIRDIADSWDQKVMSKQFATDFM